MKKITFIILFLFNATAGMLVAQSYIQLNNFWENTYFINPAAINDMYLAEFKMAARQQWYALDGAPTTYFGSATIYDNKMNTQYGIKLLQDKIGYTSVSNVDLTYAYAIQLKWDVKLHFGLAFNYQYFSNDIAKVITDSSDPSIYAPLMTYDIANNFNAGIGGELVSKYWRLGASSQNVASLFRPQRLFLNTNYLYAMYREYSSRYVNVGFGVCGVQVGRINQLQFSATTYFNSEGDSNPFQPGGPIKSRVFQLGLFYRTMSEIGGVFGADLGNNIFLAYSIDYNLGGISRNSFGTHEVMITYRLNRKWQCHNCWY